MQPLVRALLIAQVVFNVSIGIAADLPANLVTNPSLEDEVGAEGLPPGWGRFFSNPADAYRASITDGGRTGKKEMQLQCVANEAEAQFGVMPVNRVPLDRTKRYVARGWVKVAGGERATADVKLHYYEAGGAYLGQTRIGFAAPGYDDWQLVTVTDHADEFPQAGLIGLAIACTGDAQAQYDDLELLAFDKDDLPADFDEVYGVTLSPQLAILARRVGVWETTTKIKPGPRVPQGLEVTGTETVRWSLGGRVQEGRRKDPASGVEQISLLAYDPQDKVYRNWFFDSTGNLPRGESEGQWDAATQTLTFKTKLPDESSVVRMKFVNDDLIRWTGVWKDKAGQIVLDIQGTTRRRAAE